MPPNLLDTIARANHSPPGQKVANDLEGSKRARASFNKQNTGCGGMRRWGNSTIDE